MDGAKIYPTAASSNSVVIPVVDAASDTSEGSIRLLNYSQVSQELVQLALGVSLREILMYLSVEHLLSCSLVSKEWRREARSILRNKRKCFVTLGGRHPCVSLLNLNNYYYMTQVPTKDMPFNGLRLLTSEWVCCNERYSAKCIGLSQPLHQQLPFILSTNNEWPLKYLEIPDPCLLNCPVMNEIVAGFVTGKSGTLVELVLYDIPTTDELDVRKADQLFLLPKLKILHLRHVGYLSRFRPFLTHLLRNIQLIAPNLQEIRGEIRTRELIPVFGLPPAKYSLVKDLVLNPGFLSSDSVAVKMEDVAAMVLDSLEVTFDMKSGRPEDWELAKLLLENGKKSLKRLKVCYCSLLHLIRTGGLVTSLESVEELTLECPQCWELTESAHFQRLILAKAFPLSALFPKLSVVQLIGIVGKRHDEPCYCTPRGLTASLAVDLSNVDVVHTQDDSSLSLATHSTVLRLSDSKVLSPLTFPYYAQRFPQLLEFESTRISDPWSYCASLWSSWPNLKRVNLTLVAERHENFDGIFCGISEEEARVYQDSPPEFLERVNIVPTKPAVYYLRALEQISIRVIMRGIDFHQRPRIRRIYVPNLFFLSKVTGYIAFRRMRAEITVCCRPRALSHLKPFVNVK